MTSVFSDEESNSITGGPKRWSNKIYSTQLSKGSHLGRNRGMLNSNGSVYAQMI